MFVIALPRQVPVSPHWGPLQNVSHETVPLFPSFRNASGAPAEMAWPDVSPVVSLEAIEHALAATALRVRSVRSVVETRGDQLMSKP
jgi:hypothetical protein